MNNLDIDDDVPSPGTPCSVCRATGHFCQAQRYSSEGTVGICLPCKEQRACPVSIARGRTEAEMLERFEHPTAPAKSIFAEKPKGETMGTYGKLTDSQIIEIRRTALRSDRSPGSIARELGLPKDTVGYHVKKVRREATLEPGQMPPLVIPQVSQIRLSPPPPAPPTPPPPPPLPPPTPDPQHTTSSLAEVSFKINESTLDAWWFGLSATIKADMLAARLGFLLENGEAT